MRGVEGKFSKSPGSQDACESGNVFFRGESLNLTLNLAQKISTNFEVYIIA